MKFEKSMSLFHRAKVAIPSATQTFSKGAAQYPFGVAPIFIQKGQGSHVWDVDGNEFIDYPMALGPIILGHAYPAVNEAIALQLAKGITYSLPDPLELELSELFIDLIPCAEMVRFGKNGSDVTAGAVRAARAYTGKEKIVCCGYHGWQDWYIGTTTRNLGVPRSVQELTLTFPYNDISGLERVFQEHRGDVAAVIMEPVGVVEPKENFLNDVREITHKNGAVLIFDEIVTGFRLTLSGAQGYYNVIPDVACFGKAMANGMPISAVVGKREIMEIFDEIFFSFTFGGECLSLAGALATIRELKERDALKWIWNLGKKLKEGYNKIARELKLNHFTECVGLPPHTVITFKETNSIDPLLLRTLFQEEAINRGILSIGVHNICYSHNEKDINTTLDVYYETLKVIKDAIASGIQKYIKGEVVKPVFRKP